MKRFHSNLQKVLNLCQQQSRMAELELARARSNWMTSQQALALAGQNFETTQIQVNRALQTARQSTFILGMHQHLATAEERVTQAQQQTQVTEQLCQQAREKYQDLHSRVERLERLIDRQKADYRRDMQQDQQRTMDDVAIFRWTPPSQLENEVSHHG